ncbi:hypothetical protein ACFQE8_15485 [Salinirubellus sp. GCM10025818]|uniref:hypothetical protein n=1 Tax=Salinirubellus TaxID=2162630 RepID=UPI0030D0692F
MVPEQRPSTKPRTRRGLLRAAGGTLAAGVAVGATGCLSSLPPLGRGQSYGRLEVPPPDEPAYRRWLPAPSTFEVHESNYAFAYREPAPVDGGEPEEFLGRRAMSKSELDYFGLGESNYDRLLETPFGIVVEAEFEASTATETLAGSGYEPDGSYRGYDLFSRSDVPRRAAVRDGVVVWSSERVHDRPDVEALVDAGAGDRRRYHEENEAFARASEAAGANRMLIVGPDFGDPTDTAEMGADAFRFDGDVAYQVVTLRFPDGRVPTADRLERAFRDEYGLTEEAEVFDVRIDGRLATLETRVPLGEPRDLTPIEDPPQVTWGAEFDADARALTLRHETGEAVDTEWLWFDAETEARPGMIETEPLWTDERGIGPGDGDTVDLSDRPDVTGASVVLAGDECCAFRTLFDYGLGGER